MFHERLQLGMLLVAVVMLLPAQNRKQAQPKFVPPDTVEVISDIVYAQDGDRHVRLDLYLPKPRPDHRVPGVIVIRGGGWHVGDKAGFASIAAGLAQRGMAAASIEYRVIPESQFPELVYDTKAAVRWMRAEGDRYGIRPDAIGAIGGSAGGHLAALLGTSYKESSLEGSGGNAGVSSRVQAVVAMAPVVDFVALSKIHKEVGGEAARSLFGERTELAKFVSPVTYLDKDSAPILLMHSNADATVPYQQSEQMLELCKKIQVPAELVTIDGAPHAFWFQPKWASETLDKSARFFHTVLDSTVRDQSAH